MPEGPGGKEPKQEAECCWKPQEPASISHRSDGGVGWGWRWPRRSGRWKPLGMLPNLTTFSPTMSASAKMRFFRPSLMHPSGFAFFLAPRSNLVNSQVRQSGPHFETIALCYVEMLGALGAFNRNSLIMESHKSKCFSS